jgi:acyl-CoA reductase-like NAD-dependent aldehyde dehydrogenase
VPEFRQRGTFENRNPEHTDYVVGHFQRSTKVKTEAEIEAASGVSEEWAATPVAIRGEFRRTLST